MVPFRRRTFERAFNGNKSQQYFIWKQLLCIFAGGICVGCDVSTRVCRATVIWEWFEGTFSVLIPTCWSPTTKFSPRHRMIVKANFPVHKFCCWRIFIPSHSMLEQPNGGNFRANGLLWFRTWKLLRFKFMATWWHNWIWIRRLMRILSQNTGNMQSYRITKAKQSKAKDRQSVAI